MIEELVKYSVKTCLNKVQIYSTFAVQVLSNSSETFRLFAYEARCAVTCCCIVTDVYTTQYLQAYCHFTIHIWLCNTYEYSTLSYRCANLKYAIVSSINERCTAVDGRDDHPQQ